MTDDIEALEILPSISVSSVETLLTIMASSMMVIATFAVGSMVSAYASASTGATPRSFSLVLADDVSQNALSAFIGAFIFSLVSLIAIQNEMLGKVGIFVVFALTVSVFVVVIAMFLRWVDRIARLGRVPNTIEKVEEATATALRRRRKLPALGGIIAGSESVSNIEKPVFSSSAGYVQNINMARLQSSAELLNCRVRVTALPGTFVSLGVPLAGVAATGTWSPKEFEKAFTIGRERAFENDPRFGLLVLSEIADKSLSKGVNDPGTAIAIIGSMVRLLTLWQSPRGPDPSRKVEYDRISVPELEVMELFDDAFTAIARDGAAMVEVSIALQKALRSLAKSANKAVAEAAIRHAKFALYRSDKAMSDLGDVERTWNASAFCDDQEA